MAASKTIPSTLRRPNAPASSSSTAPPQPLSTIRASIAARPSAPDTPAPTGKLPRPSDQKCPDTNPGRPPLASRIARK